MTLYKCPHCATICGSRQEKDGSVTSGYCGCASKKVLKRIGILKYEIVFLSEGISQGSET